MDEKRIEVCRVRAGDVKTGFGNPRKITKAKLEELRESFERLGDFGIFIIDENDNVIGGNQRLKVVLQLFGPDQMIDCKRLIGYSDAEKRAINIKDYIVSVTGHYLKRMNGYRTLFSFYVLAFSCKLIKLLSSNLYCRIHRRNLHNISGEKLYCI